MKKHLVEELCSILEEAGYPYNILEKEKWDGSVFHSEDIKNLFFIIGRINKGWYTPLLSPDGEEGYDVLAESIEKCNLPNLAQQVRDGRFLIP